MSGREYKLSDGNTLVSSAPESEVRAWAQGEGLEIVQGDPEPTFQNADSGQAPTPAPMPSDQTGYDRQPGPTALRATGRGIGAGTMPEQGPVHTAARTGGQTASLGGSSRAYGLGAAMGPSIQGPAVSAAMSSPATMPLAALLAAFPQPTHKRAERGIDGRVMDDGAAEVYQQAEQSYLDASEEGARQNPAAGEVVGPLGGHALGFAAGGPQMKAAQGAGLGSRAAVGAGNVGVDALMGAAGGYGMSEGATESERLDDAQTGALFSGGIGGVLRGGAEVPGMVAGSGRWAGRKLANARAIFEPDDVSRLVREFTEGPPAAKGATPASEALASLDPAAKPRGEALRAAAVDGADLDQASRSMHRDLNTIEDVADMVRGETSVRLKPSVMAPHMAEEGITDPHFTRIMTNDYIQGVIDKIEALRPVVPKGTGGPGANAMTRVGAAIERYKERASGLSDGADGVAELFSALDELKRTTDAAAKKAGTGATPNDDVRLAFQSAADDLRELLQDSNTWGDSAAALQTNVNAMFHRHIPALQEFRSRFGSRHATDSVSSNVYARRKKVGSEQVDGLLQGAGTARNADSEASLRAYLKAQPELLETLAKYYEVGGETLQAMPSMTSAVERAGAGLESAVVADAADASSRIQANLDGTITSADAARRLEEIRSSAPRVLGIPGTSPADNISAIAKAERYARDNNVPELYARGKDIIGGVARSAAIGSGIAQADSAEAQAPPAPKYSTTSQKIEALAASNPEQLGPYGSVLNDALQRGPDHFRAYHSTLQQTDPEYQKLLRELEEGEYNEQPIGNGG